MIRLLIIFLLSFSAYGLIDLVKEYEHEITRQESVIKEQHGKLCMLDGILRNEIKHFTLTWVNLESPVY